MQQQLADSADHDLRGGSRRLFLIEAFGADGHILLLLDAFGSSNYEQGHMYSRRMDAVRHSRRIEITGSGYSGINAAATRRPSASSTL